MAERKSSKSAPKPAQTREERLKAALKANLGRRKAQAKAREGDADGTDSETPER